jgi:hypothetical protein
MTNSLHFNKSPTMKISEIATGHADLVTGAGLAEMADDVLHLNMEPKNPRAGLEYLAIGRRSL